MTQTFIVRGDSMAPEFIDGDQVHYDPAREPRHGQFVAARIGAAVVVRQHAGHQDGAVLGVVVEARRLYR